MVPSDNKDELKPQNVLCLNILVSNQLANQRWFSVAINSAFQVRMSKLIIEQNHLSNSQSRRNHRLRGFYEV